MSSPFRLTLKRRQTILERQDPPKWGCAYVPSILATREEAPSISRAVQLWSAHLDRYVHLLSTIEVRPTLIALHHPKLFELQEQRMLAMEPRPNPLSLHPTCSGMDLPPFEGTLSVADRLGVLGMHPVVHFKETGHSQVAAFPWIGDLLLFMRDERGPYCMNWTVKKTAAGFRVPLSKSLPDRDPLRAAAQEEARHAVELAYYRDAQVRTQQVVKADIDDALFNTMMQLFLWLRRPANVPEPERLDILDRFRAVISAGRPPLDEIIAMKRHFALSMESFKAILFQAIWNRELRVDLWSAIFIDRPLVPERRDVLAHYDAWFRRGGTDE